MAKKYLTSQEAVEALGVTPATLYAYVSRGMIRSEASDKTHRERRYLAEDVLKLVERKAQRTDPAKAAQAAMNWGTPILDSALTLITETGLYYRGVNVAELAQERTFEEVAALLWTGEIDASVIQPEPPTLETAALQSGRFLPNLQISLALAAESDWQAWQLQPKAVRQVGARILHLLTGAITFPERHSGRIGEQLAQAWHTEPTLIDKALILCADHELNASSFTARVVASTDANLYAVVAGGLAALSGAKHGGFTARVAALFRELDGSDHRGDQTAIRYALRERMQRGDGLPGFGHRLYPAGDPRAVILLDALKVAANNDRLQRDLALTEQIRALIHEEPTIDLALTVMERALNLPSGAALALFALGRSAGWIAHALEQYPLDSLIRPRARYVGKTPGNAERI